MAALVSAIDTHGDLMRMSVAVPGNEFRLGACEAPPAIMSTYLGEDVTECVLLLCCCCFAPLSVRPPRACSRLIPPVHSYD